MNPVRSTLAFSILLVLSSAACDNRRALEKRMEEFRYEPTSLAEALIKRLQSVGKKKVERQSQKAANVNEVEKGRNLDGNDRPDPNSMAAIVLETKAQIATVEDSAGNELAILEQVVSKIRASKKVEESIINSFKQAMRSSLQ